MWFNFVVVVVKSNVLLFAIVTPDPSLTIRRHYGTTNVAQHVPSFHQLFYISTREIP
jgi:hypothetical protein